MVVDATSTLYAGQEDVGIAGCAPTWPTSRYWWRRSASTASRASTTRSTEECTAGADPAGGERLTADVEGLTSLFPGVRRRQLPLRLQPGRQHLRPGTTVR